MSQPSSANNHGFFSHRFFINSKIAQKFRKVKCSMRIFNERILLAHGISKANAVDTYKEMGKFFCMNEAKASLQYGSSLASEVHEELVKRNLRLAFSTFRSVWYTSSMMITSRLFTRSEKLVFDNSGEDDSDDQE